MYLGDGVGCSTPLPGLVAAIRADLEADGAPDGEFRGIMHQVYAFEAGRGADVMAALKRNCSMLASRTGHPPGSYEFIELPSIGDEAIALHDAFGVTNAIWDSEQVNAGYLYIRRGDVVSELSVLTSGDLDLRRVAEMADAKLATTGPMPEPSPVIGQGCVTSPTPEPERASEVSAGLLTLEDMPVGWVHDPPSPCGMIGGEGECEDSEDTPSLPTPLVQARTGFAGQRYSYVASGVALFSKGEAEAFMEGVRRRVSAASPCSASNDGESFEWHDDQLDAPPVGEDAIAWHVTTQGLPSEVDVYVLLIRRGRAVGTLSLRPSVDRLDPSDTLRARDELATFAELADKKLQLVEGAAAD